MDRLDALRFLLDIADKGSFSAVARQRSVATSTVALAVSQLEREVAARLMVRSTRLLVFTSEGESLLADARRILAEWDGALASLREDGPLAGPIRLTATNDFGRKRLRPLLDAFQDQHTRIRTSLMLDDSTVDIIEQRFDLALRTGPLPDSTLRARLLVRGPRRVCASPAYWARAPKPSRPSDLADHNCIVLARPGAPLAVWPFRDGHQQLSVKVSGDREASDGDVLREWAVEGRGVILKNEWDIRDELQTGTLDSALDAFNAGPIDLFALHPAGPPSRRVAALVDFLVAGLSRSDAFIDDR